MQQPQNCQAWTTESGENKLYELIDPLVKSNSYQTLNQQDKNVEIQIKAYTQPTLDKKTGDQNTSSKITTTGKKYFRRKQNQISEKNFACGSCQKQYTTSSSLYTHIKVVHDHQIQDQTTQPLMKKKDMQKTLEKQKGVYEQTKKWQFEIDQDTISFFKDPNLLKTYLILDKLVTAKDKQIMDYFHPESEDCIQTLKELYSDDLNEQPVFFNNRIQNMVTQYVKPFTKIVAKEIIHILKLAVDKVNSQDNDQKLIQYVHTQLEKLIQQDQIKLLILPDFQQFIEIIVVVFRDFLKRLNVSKDQ